MSNPRDKFEPYGPTIHIIKRRLKADILDEVCKLALSNKLKEATALYETIPEPKDCTCKGWGCLYCCATLEEVRSRQGIFG